MYLLIEISIKTDGYELEVEQQKNVIFMFDRKWYSEWFRVVSGLVPALSRAFRRAAAQKTNLWLVEQSLLARRVISLQ